LGCTLIFAGVEDQGQGLGKYFRWCELIPLLAHVIEIILNAGQVVKINDQE